MSLDNIDEFQERMAELPGTTDLVAGALSPDTRPVHGILQLTKTQVTLDVHQEEGFSQNQKERKRKSSKKENLNETKRRKPNKAQDDFNEITVESGCSSRAPSPIIMKKKSLVENPMYHKEQ